jgi:protein-disulfide isomerase
VRAAPPAQITSSREIDVFDGRFKIKIEQVPVLGDPNAPAVMINLFDYTCPHCRRMHGLLLAAEEAHRGALAIADLPMPLDAKCNRLVSQTAPKHVNACQYARLGLAVWRADRSKMSRFNHWMFDPDIPPGLDSALGYAAELVGDAALERALNDSWVREQLAQDIAIYETTTQHFGNTAMPQMIIGTQVVFGELAGGMQDLEPLLGQILQ